jgi:hypothetical protein
MTTPDSNSDSNPRRVTRADRGVDESQHYPGSPSPEVLRQMADVRNVAVPSSGYTKTSPQAPGLGGPPYQDEQEPASQSHRTPRLVNPSDEHPVGSPDSGRSLPLTAPASDRARVLRDLGKPAPADPSQGSPRLHRVSGVRGNAFDRDPLWSKRARERGRS